MCPMQQRQRIKMREQKAAMWTYQHTSSWRLCLKKKKNPLLVDAKRTQKSFCFCSVSIYGDMLYRNAAHVPCVAKIRTTLHYSWTGLVPPLVKSCTVSHSKISATPPARHRWGLLCLFCVFISCYTPNSHQFWQLHENMRWCLRYWNNLQNFSRTISKVSRTIVQRYRCDWFQPARRSPHRHQGALRLRDATCLPFIKFSTEAAVPLRQRGKV